MKTSNSAIKEYANYKKKESETWDIRLEQFWSLHVYLLSHNWNVYCNLGQDWDLPLPEIRWANGEKCWPLLSWIFFVGAICPKYSTFSKGLFFVKLAKKSQCERSKQIFKLEKLYQKKRKQSIYIFFTVFAPLGCCGRTPALLKEKSFPHTCLVIIPFLSPWQRQLQQPKICSNPVISSKKDGKSPKKSVAVASEKSTKASI